MKHPRGSRGPINRLAAVVFTLGLLFSTIAAFTGCVGDHEETTGLEQLGSVGLHLDVVPGITLLSVAYEVSGNGFVKTGTLDVGQSPVISGTIGGIPAGSGYTLELSATSVEDETVFSGSATFNVRAGQTTAVTVHLVGTSDGGTGSVSVIGTINVGPVIDELTVTPLAVFVGQEVSLTVVALDANRGPSPLTYAWSASAGVIANPTEPTTKFTSTTAGTVTVTVTVSDGELTAQRTTAVTFVNVDEGSGGASGTGGEAGGGGTSAEPRSPLELVSTATAPNTAGVTSTVLQIPSAVEPGDVAVVFVLSTGSAPIVASPEGFVTTALAAAQHSLSYGPIGNQTSLTWTSSTTATTGATAFFFRGDALAVEVLGTNQLSGSTFGLDAATRAPTAAFASGYALFGVQLPVASTPTVTTGPAGSWLGPVTDGRQLWSWSQPYVPGPDGFLFPASLGGTLSASAVKRQAQVFVSSPAE